MCHQPNILLPHNNLVTMFFKPNHDRWLVFFIIGNEWIITNVKVRPIIEALYQQR